MNYRHAYHAGNFADVLKHAVLALVIEHLKLKPAPFRVIDTHAGIGLYDLSAPAPTKTGEWREGIGRILAAHQEPAVAAALAPYLGVVREFAAPGQLPTLYPGSPLIARRLMRRQDRLVANELHPEDCDTLKRLFARDPQVKVLGLDGWIALKSLLPPKERRGVVLIDPPFEQPGELERLAQGLCAAVRRFSTGTFLLWYPIKDPGPVCSFRRQAAALMADQGLEELWIVELSLRAHARPDELNGCGLLMLNPPFTLPGMLNVLLPFLASTLGKDTSASYLLECIGRTPATGAMPRAPRA